LEESFNKDEFYLNILIKFFIENDNISKLINETQDFEEASKIVSKLDLFIKSWGHIWIVNIDIMKSLFKIKELEFNPSSFLYSCIFLKQDMYYILVYELGNYIFKKVQAYYVKVNDFL
jgi:hypothetical protein